MKEAQVGTVGNNRSISLGAGNVNPRGSYFRFGNLRDLFFRKNLDDLSRNWRLKGKISGLPDAGMKVSITHQDVSQPCLLYADEGIRKIIGDQAKARLGFSTPESTKLVAVTMPRKWPKNHSNGKWFSFRANTGISKHAQAIFSPEDICKKWG